MLTQRTLDDLLEPMLDSYDRFFTTVLLDIVRRMRKVNGLTPTALWQVQRLQESGMLYQDILRQVALQLHMNEKDLQQLLENAGVESSKFDIAIFERAGFKPLPLHLSPAMLQVLRSNFTRTNGTLTNLTRTIADGFRQAFIKATDTAHLQITSGAMSIDQATRLAIKELANIGVTQIGYRTRKDQADVAVRRALLTGVGQTVGELTLQQMRQMGTDLVQTSAHIGARPTHEPWQGHVFSLSGASPKYPPFYPTTGYGEVDGLMGVNCRHTFFPFFEGLSQEAYTAATLEEYADKAVTYNGRSYTVYEATQLQRGMERDIRKLKREATLLGASGLDNTKELREIASLQSDLRSFVKQTGLPRQSNREGPRAPKAVVVTPPPPNEPPLVPPAPTPTTSLDAYSRKTNAALDFAEQRGFPRNRIEFNPSPGPYFKVGNRTYQEGGHYSPSSARIVIWNTKTHTLWELKSMLSHEITHDAWHNFRKAFDHQHAMLAYEKNVLGKALNDLPIFANGAVKSGKKKAWWGLDLQYWVDTNGSELKRLDGVTDYSRSYWAAYMGGHQKRSLEDAFNETLAEISRLFFEEGITPEMVMAKPYKEMEQFTTKSGAHVAPIWQEFWARLMRTYPLDPFSDTGAKKQ